MKVKSNGSTFALANNGVSESSGNDGASVLLLTFSVVSTDTFAAVKAAFTASKLIEITDDAGTTTTKYDRYINLTGITYQFDNDTVTVSLRTPTDTESLKAQITEAQEAIAALAGGEA